MSKFVAEPSPLHTTTIVEKCTLKLVDEYKHMLCQATEPLSTFLEYCTYVASFSPFFFFRFIAMDLCAQLDREGCALIQFVANHSMIFLDRNFF